MEYPWYKLLNEKDFSLEQGDIISDCPIFIPPSNFILGEDQTIPIEIQTSNVVVLTQSCDLTHGKTTIVQVCPYYPIDELDFISEVSGKEKLGRKDKLRTGLIPGFHLLNQCSIDENNTDFLAVDFRNVYGVDFSYLTTYVGTGGKRLRLLPPYREHLSQAFARYFMRVGLPTDIPKFK